MHVRNVLERFKSAARDRCSRCVRATKRAVPSRRMRELCRFAQNAFARTFSLWCNTPRCDDGCTGGRRDDALESDGVRVRWLHLLFVSLHCWTRVSAAYGTNLRERTRPGCPWDRMRRRQSSRAREAGRRRRHRRRANRRLFVVRQTPPLF